MKDTSPIPRSRLFVAATAATLLAIAICFRVMRLSSVPGVSGDEGWWGVQAIAWCSGRPYETHTTSGNPVDLLLLVPLGLLHAIASPSFLVLRTIPAAVNLLALPLSFWLVRRVYGDTTAWLHTVALAISPTAIAHSRICYDPSQSIFWTSLAVLLPLIGFEAQRRVWLYLGASILFFLLAVHTHPTNVFVAPFLVLPVVSALRPLLPASAARRAFLAMAAAFVAALTMAAVVTALGHLAPSNEYLNQPWPAIAFARLTDGRQWFEFAANNARLFNGVTIYHYFSGARPVTFYYDAAFVIVTVVALAGFCLAPARRLARDGGLLVACGLTWSVFYVFAGPAALRPHFERWGLCLIVPGTLVLARGVGRWLESSPRARWPAIAGASLIGVGLVASFYVNYFGEFAATGGRSHLTYVTATPEPKEQALERILAMASGTGPIAVVTTQWWLAWPIAYLATPHSYLTVTLGAPPEGRATFDEALRAGRLFFVEFAGRQASAGEWAWIQGRGLRASRTTIHDAGGHDLIEILHVSKRSAVESAEISLRRAPRVMSTRTSPAPSPEAQQPETDVSPGPQGEGNEDLPYHPHSASRCTASHLPGGRPRREAPCRPDWI